VTPDAAGAPTRPELSVVVPTYQRRDALQRLLTALTRQTLTPDSFEVVVAVDGSTDGTVELLEALAAPYALHVVHQPNRGRAAARNAAIRATRGDVIVILDDDMEPAPELLAAHRDAHAAHERLGVMGAVPVVLPHAPTSLQRCFAARFQEHHRVMTEPGGGFLLRSFYIGNFSIRREHLIAAGLLDEDFVAYGNEDLELAVRLRSAGIPIEFLPEAVARQHWSKDLAAAARDAVDKGRTAVLLASKHPDAASELRLGTFDEASGAFRAARGLALRISSVWPRFPGLVVAATRLAEHLRVPGLERWYELLLGYLYWVGAQEARSRLHTPAGINELE
jgi:glycosyltransferase involved in cell wall biosynthesis